jgi:phospholipid/cholesterol/gamma-HCH transport system substrate-binding protein
VWNGVSGYPAFRPDQSCEKQAMPDLRCRGQEPAPVSRAIREYGRYVAAIVFFAVLSVVCGVYILSQQHLRTPFQDRYTVKVQMPTSQSLTSGKNQPVNVAGVRVGDVVKTELQDGRSTVTLSVDKHKLPAVFSDAEAQLRPNTPLKDMQIELFPGHRASGRLRDGGTIRVEKTLVPVDSDEFLAALDADTRAYFQALVAASERGLKGRGHDLRAALRALGPTTTQLHQLGDALAARRTEMRRLVHNLAVLSHATAAKDRELGTAVEAGATTLRAIAGRTRPCATPSPSCRARCRRLAPRSATPPLWPTRSARR